MNSPEYVRQCEVEIRRARHVRWYVVDYLDDEPLSLTLLPVIERLEAERLAEVRKHDGDHDLKRSGDALHCTCGSRSLSMPSYVERNRWADAHRKEVRP